MNNLLLDFSPRNFTPVYVPSVFYEKTMDQYCTRKRQKCRSDIPFPSRTTKIIKRYKI